MNEERNKLVKVRIDYQGNGQWYMKPEYNKKGSQIRKGERYFRGTDEEFRKFLVKCKVKDTDSEPASQRNKKYADIVQDMKAKKKTYVWMYLNNWNASNTMESVEMRKQQEVYQGTWVAVDSETGKKVKEFPNKKSAREWQAYQLDVEGKEESDEIMPYSEWERNYAPYYESTITIPEGVKVVTNEGTFLKEDAIDFTDEKEVYEYISNAPREVLDDIMTYWANKKILWSSKKITMSKKNIESLKNIQKALDRMGVDNQEFLSYATISESTITIPEKVKVVTNEGTFLLEPGDKISLNEMGFDMDDEPEPDDDDIFTEPDDDDIFIVSKPMRGYDISAEGRFLGNYSELDDVENTIKLWMNKHNFFPNVWFVDDHGGMELYTLDESVYNDNEGKRKMKKQEAVLRKPEDIMKAIKRAFRAEMGIEEMEVAEEENFGIDYYEVESEDGSASNGEREWMVFTDSDEAKSYAIEDVREMLEDEPELFNQDFIQQFMFITDTDRRTIANDEAMDYAYEVLDEDDVLREADMTDDWQDLEDEREELYDKYTDLEDKQSDAESDEEYDRIQEELDKIDARMDEIRDEKEKLVDSAREKVEEEKYDEVYEALEDPIQYFVKDMGMYRIEDLFEQPFISINVKDAAQEAVNVDGVSHFLDMYDGEEEEITDPESGMTFYVYGTN